MLLQARAVANHDGGAVVGLRLAECPERLGLICTHGHLCHIHIAILHQDAAQILLGHLFAAGGELCRGTGGRCLGRLSAGVGVHLGIQHHQIHVAVLRHHMVDAAEADVIGPAVAANRPDRLARQIRTVFQNVRSVVVLGRCLHSGEQRIGHSA